MKDLCRLLNEPLRSDLPPDTRAMRAIEDLEIDSSCPKVGVGTRFFKLRWSNSFDSTRLVEYHRLPNMALGYIDQMDCELELIERGLINPEHLEHLQGIWELNKAEYERALKRCIRIVA